MLHVPTARTCPFTGVHPCRNQQAKEQALAVADLRDLAAQYQADLQREQGHSSELRAHGNALQDRCASLQTRCEGGRAVAAGALLYRPNVLGTCAGAPRGAASRRAVRSAAASLPTTPCVCFWKWMGVRAFVLLGLDGRARICAFGVGWGCAHLCLSGAAPLHALANTKCNRARTQGGVAGEPRGVTAGPLRGAADQHAHGGGARRSPAGALRGAAGAGDVAGE